MKKIKYTAYSCSKINIFLDVLSLRSNGYHNIDSLFIPLNWADKLILEEAQEMKWVSTDSYLQNQDLYKLNFGKIMDCLKPYAHNSKNFSLTLIKNVPYQAGLGIASSNAVAFIKILNKFWDCRLQENDLKKISTEIGSDCLFFFQDKIARVESTGDKITPISNLPGLYPILVLKPKNIHISTANAYESIKSKNYYSRYTNVSSFLDKNNYKNLFKWDVLSQISQNSFFDVMKEEYPELQEIKDKINSQSIIQMSGSGSSMFVIFKNKNSIMELFKETSTFIENNFDFFISIL